MTDIVERLRHQSSSAFHMLWELCLQASSEIERLRAELTVKHHDWMSEYGSAAEGRREIARLRDELERNRADLIVEADRANGAEAERDALRKDAERYRAMRAQLPAGIWGMLHLSYVALDLAIDDAIAAPAAKERT